MQLCRLLLEITVVEWNAVCASEHVAFIGQVFRRKLLLLRVFCANESGLDGDGLFVGGHDGGLVDCDRFFPLPVALLKFM